MKKTNFYFVYIIIMPISISFIHLFLNFFKQKSEGQSLPHLYNKKEKSKNDLNFLRFIIIIYTFRFFIHYYINKITILFNYFCKHSSVNTSEPQTLTVLFKSKPLSSTIQFFCWKYNI